MKTLRAKQPYPFRDQKYNLLYQVPTLEEYIQVALVSEAVCGQRHI